MYGQEFSSLPCVTTRSRSGAARAALRGGTQATAGARHNVAAKAKRSSVAVVLAMSGWYLDSEQRMVAVARDIDQLSAISSRYGMYNRPARLALLLFVDHLNEVYTKRHIFPKCFSFR